MLIGDWPPSVKGKCPHCRHGKIQDVFYIIVFKYGRKGDYGGEGYLCRKHVIKQTNHVIVEAWQP